MQKNMYIVCNGPKCIEKYFLQIVNNQALSWLTTAQAVPSPYPCIEISLLRADVQKPNLSAFEHGFNVQLGTVQTFWTSQDHLYN